MYIYIHIWILLSFTYRFISFRSITLHSLGHHVISVLDHSTIEWLVLFFPLFQLSVIIEHHILLFPEYVRNNLMLVLAHLLDWFKSLNAEEGILITDSLQLNLVIIDESVSLLLPSVGYAVQILFFLLMQMSQLFTAAISLPITSGKHILQLLNLACLWVLCLLKFVDLSLQF